MWIDMWALGCVVYEMIHRRPAFKAEALFELQVRTHAISAHQAISLCIPVTHLTASPTRHPNLQGLIRNCNFTPFNKHIRVPPDAKALIRGLLTVEHKRLTAEQVLRESPWVSEEAAAARALEKEMEKERAAALEEEAKRRAATGAFGL